MDSICSSGFRSGWSILTTIEDLTNLRTSGIKAEAKSGRSLAKPRPPTKTPDGGGVFQSGIGEHAGSIILPYLPPPSPHR